MEVKKIKVSIIIPMYNSEKYISRCLNSVINQTYENIEILIIDDGSTDKSRIEIEKIKDKRIKLFSKENSGTSDTRNFGLLKASGDFITFVDIDDYIDKFMIEKLIEKVNKEDMCLVIGNNIEVYKNREEERKVFQGETREIEKKEAMRTIAGGLGGLVANKLFSKKIIEKNNINFNKNVKISEDQLFFLEVAQKSEKIIYSNQNLYFYDRRNEKSATQKYQNNMLENFLELQSAIESIFRKNKMDTQEDKKLLNNKIFNWFLICLLNEVRHKGISKSKKTIDKLIIKTKKLEREYVKPSNFIYKIILLNIKDNFISKRILLYISKVLILKNG